MKAILKGTSKNPCLSFESIFFSDTSLAKYSFNAAKLRFCCLVSEKNLRFKFSKWVFRSTLKLKTVGLVMALSLAWSPALGQQSPLHYVCKQAQNALVIDGEANETDWQSAAWTSLFIDIEGDKKPEPYLGTRVKMLWDSNYFYFYAQLEEPHIQAKLKQRDTVIFYDNDFEIFIDPDGDTHNYYEFEFNAFNTVWDLLLTRPYRDGGHAIDHWDAQGLKSAVSISGTINNPMDEDQGWSIEVAIPWEVLREATRMKTPPQEGDFWRVNFSRVQWETEVINGKYVKKKAPGTEVQLPENNWVWSPMRVIAMHEPEFWGIVQFTLQTTDLALTHEQEFEMVAKNMLYAVHRKQQQLNQTWQKWAESLESLKLKPFLFKGKPLEVKISTHAGGYLVQVSQQPFEGQWMLDQTGRSWKVKK